MQTMIYRKIETNAWEKAFAEAQVSGIDTSSASTRKVYPLTPELFYPLVTAQEMRMWQHWLPTSFVFTCSKLASPEEVTHVLRKLHAPDEVLEEFRWAWNGNLFDTYEVRTPIRRDARDPLLLGRLGTQSYRVALWGESLRSQEEIQTLVEQSLVLRDEAARWRLWLTGGGALLGAALGVYLGSMPTEETPLGTGLLFTFLGLALGWLPLFLYTPENRQHNFLDRYRC